MVIVTNAKRLRNKCKMKEKRKTNLSFVIFFEFMTINEVAEFE